MAEQKQKWFCHNLCQDADSKIWGHLLWGVDCNTDQAGQGTTATASLQQQDPSSMNHSAQVELFACMVPNAHHTVKVCIYLTATYHTNSGTMPFLLLT